MKAINGWKTCARCKETMPVENFGRSVARSDGLNSYCRECYRIVNRRQHPQRRNLIKRPVFREHIYPFVEVALREDWTLVLDTLTPGDYREAFGCSRSCGYIYFHRAAYDFSDEEYGVVWSFVYDKAREEVTHASQPALPQAS